ncbi:fibrillin-2-like [Liolophura sinensis]|uniref:fibrillin-2-like n=1 Tax=Liolophura sinensis TaxID=3198878 RepID=UPI0031597F13
MFGTAFLTVLTALVVFCSGLDPNGDHVCSRTDRESYLQSTGNGYTIAYRDKITHVCCSGWKTGNNEDCNIDINECFLDLDRCDDNCINTDGSYRCSCSRSGYELDIDGFSCREVTSDNWQLTVGLGIGIPGVGIIIFVCLCLWCCGCCC